MTRYVVVSALSGILFGILDGVVHANPLARKLYSYYGSIARTSVNAPAGLAIDLVYGFVMAALFLILYKALPGGSGLAKGLFFGVVVWFFRVVMGGVGEWMMVSMPPAALIYRLGSGFVEMLLLGAFYGFTLRGH